MANRAYLQCLPKRSDVEIVASYSLPDVWLDLFGPADFHTGNECPIPNACRPHTTTYFLAEAPIAIKRFTDRMKRAKIPLDGDGLTAQFHRWLTTHFAEGWLFSDVTELQWMSDDFIPYTRKQLVNAEKRVRRSELDPKSLLLDLGWGTGLSPEEIKRALEEARRNPQDVTKLEGRPYRMEDTYAVGEIVAHPIFGSGTVRTCNESKISIAFPMGTKTLAQGKR